MKRTVKVTDPFLAPSRGAMKDVLTFFDRYPPVRRSDAERVVRRVFQRCHEMGIDFSLAMSRIGDETGDPNGPAIFVSDIFKNRLNIGGLGVTDGSDELITFQTPEDAADAYMAHLGTYLFGPKWVTPIDHTLVSGTTIDGLSYKDDVRYSATPLVWMGTVKTIEDLQGKWFTNPNGAASSVARGNAIFADLGTPADGDHTVPTPPAPTGPRKIIGHVPHPPAILSYWIGSVHSVDGAGRDPDQVRQGRIVGSCLHTSEGYFNGNHESYASPTWGGLTDAQVGGPWDNEHDGVIEIFIDPASQIVPWANGTVGSAVAPYGDGPGFITAFGKGAVNSRIRSLETTDGGNPDVTKGQKQMDMACFYLAYVHAEEAHQTPETFAWRMDHREFGGAHQQCPGRYIIERADQINQRTKDIMAHFLYGDLLNPPLMVTYPPGWTGPRVPDAPVPPPPPIVYPKRRVPILPPVAARTITLGGVGKIKLEVNPQPAYHAIHGGYFTTAPNREAPHAVATPYKASKVRLFRFPYAAAVDDGKGVFEHWLVSAAGSWALAKNFTPSTGR